MTESERYFFKEIDSLETKLHRLNRQIRIRNKILNRMYRRRILMISRLRLLKCAAKRKTSLIQQRIRDVGHLNIFLSSASDDFMNEAPEEVD